MKKILLILALLISHQSFAEVTDNTIGCDTPEDYSNLMDAFANSDQRMLDHLANAGICYQFKDGLEYSLLGTSGLFDLYQKIRVWTPDGKYIDTYITKFEAYGVE